MERRWGMRKAIQVDVVIDNQPACLLRGRIGNVSTGGLFVQTEPTSLSQNEQVELVLMLQQESGTRVYRISAMVVRLAQDGAGLMFDQYDVNAFRALVVLLLAQQKAARTQTNKERVNALSFSKEGGRRVASTLEGTTGVAAGAVGSLAPISQQASPV